MSFDPDKQKPNEALKCRHRILHYLRGHGLDLGPGMWKIIPQAIGVDLVFGASDVCLDASNLSIFKDRAFDYVFSAHLLEELSNTEAVLKEWWRVIKPGGYLILYLPHKDYYPNVGTQDANTWHLYDFRPQDILDIAEKNFAADLMQMDTHIEGDEYSFEIVLKKSDRIIKGVKDCRKTTPENTCYIVRYGAFGDAVQVTPIIRRIKDEGYHVIVETSARGGQILRENPHIDELRIIPDKSIPENQLDYHWDKTAALYKRFINLSGVVEGTLLFKRDLGPHPYDYPDAMRRHLANVNYNDAYHMRAGYEDNAGYIRPEMYFSEAEEKWARDFLARKVPAGVKHLIMWSWAGSGWNKKYPWAGVVIKHLVEKYPDVAFITVGDVTCQMLEWGHKLPPSMKNDLRRKIYKRKEWVKAVQKIDETEWRHPRIICQSGLTTMRQTAILAKYVDCVVGPETGVLNIAACWDVPKVLLLSHSSHENLSKYWSNVAYLQPKAPCSPCHRLVYEREECPPGNPLTGALPCASTIPAKGVIDAILYWKERGPQGLWKEAKNHKEKKRLGDDLRQDCPESGLPGGEAGRTQEAIKAEWFRSKPAVLHQRGPGTP